MRFTTEVLRAKRKGSKELSLPAELDRKIQLRFDELIEEVETLLAELDEYDEVHYLRYREWQVKANGLLTRVFADSAERKEYVGIVKAHPGPTSWSYISDAPRKIILASSVKRTIATLKGIEDNYVNGFYVGLEKQIIANVSADYMEQAEALLEAGFYVPAAVLMGAVLEDALRRLSQKQTPPIDIVKSTGDKKTLEPLIQDLQRAKVFNKLVGDQLRAWAKIRNYAAHGEFSEFTREQVDLMLPGVRQFLVQHL